MESGHKYSTAIHHQSILKKKWQYCQLVCYRYCLFFFYTLFPLVPHRFARLLSWDVISCSKDCCNSGPPCFIFRIYSICTKGREFPIIARVLRACLHCPAVRTTEVWITVCIEVVCCNSTSWTLRVWTKRFLLHINITLYKQDYINAN